MLTPRCRVRFERDVEVPIRDGTVLRAPPGRDRAGDRTRSAGDRTRSEGGCMTTLGVRGTRFTLDDEPRFLLGISYYAGLGAGEALLRRDLDEIRRLGFNWIRVWVTWAAFGNDVSVVDVEGKPREEYLARLEALVAACAERGLVLDVTFSRGNGVTGPPRLQRQEHHLRAIEAVVARLRSHPNWYLDLGNERNLTDQRFVSFEELRELRQLARRLDPARLVTASHASHDLTRDDVRAYLETVEADFLAPHRPRNAASAEQTEGRTREFLAWARELGREAPVHYQEPFRRGFGRWEPSGDDFVADLRGALAGGAAGWCFHNGDVRNHPEGRPRRSFDLRDGSLFEQLDAVERAVVERLGEVARPAG
jgi:hypothetical protein